MMSKNIIYDNDWVDRGIPCKWQIALCTFSILAIEMALIRWTATQIRCFAYFNNIVLIGAFLGMGIGLVLGKRYPGLIHGILPVLLIASIPIAFSENLGLVHLKFPDPFQSIFIWDSISYSHELPTYVKNLSIFLIIYVLICSVFVLAGAPVGNLFSKKKNLEAYAYDLFGSLVGVVAITIITFLCTSPPVWLFLGCLPIVVLTRNRIAILSLILIVLLGMYSEKGAVYSPYNRIDLSEKGLGLELSVNRDFHQYMYDLSDKKIKSSPNSDRLQTIRRSYDLSFSINPSAQTSLIVGAGTGNDVQAALRKGFKKIWSVDIDGEIIELGKKHHPESPYDSEAVVPIVNDARAFFEQYDGPPFDVVCYGLLDSHAMFSSMSSLRLDNFVYTKNGIEAGWRHVSDKGHMSLSFWAFSSQWIAERLYWTIAEATGTEPLCIINGEYGFTYVVAKDWNAMDLSVLKKSRQYRRYRPLRNREMTKITSDDWPFLYLNPNVVPWTYMIVIAIICVISLALISFTYRIKNVRQDFDTTTFFLGAAFLLLQTRGITSMSLLFGSTWIVNSAMFTSILFLLWISTLAVKKYNFRNPYPWFAGLFLSLIFLWLFDISSLNKVNELWRGVLGGLVNGLPIAFAGIVFPIVFSSRKNSSSSLGSNLLGAVLGGCMEYTSMYIGLSNIVGIAIVFYLLACLSFRKTFVAIKAG